MTQFWPYAYDDVYEGIFGAYALGHGDTNAAVEPPSGYGGGYARGGYARGSAGGRADNRISSALHFPAPNQCFALR